MKRNLLKLVLLGLYLIGSNIQVSAQSEIYPQHFDLEEITLLDGPLKVAMDKNIDMLLQYDVDRLLTPYVRQAGLNSGDYAGWETNHPIQENWGSGDFHLEGHVGGHYMTALALAYAACHDATTKTTIKARVAHMLEVLKDCQDAYDNNTVGLYGFIGGQPCNDAWKTCYQGNIGNFGTSAVPLYCQHKILAGLRDMYLYMDGDEAAAAKVLYRKLCDWHVNLIGNMSDNTLQDWLGTEHGGVNETLVDAYRIFGDTKYLAAAKRYSHQWEVNGMQTLNTTFLDNQHANTQVPKFIGFARIAQEDETATAYQTAAKNFWDDVSGNRTVCIGGNSVNEHFMSSAAGNRYIDETNGPESCNTNNMLKLSEDLFDTYHDSKYVDFYEAATYNHILSTQDPQTGGYVYFTPLRPQSYRIYSMPNQDMWCCVGTGMENHSKYGHFIYTHNGSTLYVNLFTASSLQNDTYALTQETNFPYEQATKITIEKAGVFTLAVRKPSWAGDDFAVKINGATAAITMSDGYATVSRSWSKGDVVTVLLPMTLRYEQCPNQQDYIAFKYGPILLGARTTSVSENDGSGLEYEALSHEYALGERMGHAPDSYAPKKALSSMPLLIGDRSQVLERITPLNANDMTFALDVTRNDVYASSAYAWDTLTLAPYYSLHHSRVNNYFYQQTAENYSNSTWAKDEIADMELDAKSLCSIDVGQQQAEAGAVTHSSESSMGTWKDESYRDLTAKDAWMQIVLENDDPSAQNLSLILRLNADDAGRACDIYVNDEKLASYTVPNNVQGTNDRNFYNLELPLEDKAYDVNGQAKSRFVVRIVATTNLGPGLYWIRLIKDGYSFGGTHYEFNARDFRIGDGSRATSITYNADNSFTISGKNGANNICYGMKVTDNVPDKYYVTPEEHWYIVKGTGLDISTDNKSYIWWFNGYNDGGSVSPDFVMEKEGVQILAWDISKHDKLNGNFKGVGSKIAISNNGNDFVECVGLSSARTDGKATISLVDYITDLEVYELKNDVQQYEFHASDFRTCDTGRAPSVTVNANNAFTVNGNEGTNNICFGLSLSKSENYYVNSDQKWYVVMGTGLNSHARDYSYIWFMNGDNLYGRRPIHVTEINGVQIMAWDISEVLGNDINILGDTNGYGFVDCVGLTSAQDDHKATITGVYYMTDEQVSDIFGTDMTSAIPNPSFETGNINPWVLSKNTAWNGINNRNGEADWSTDGDKIFGVWDGTSNDVKISQSVTLPLGKYTLMVDMLASNENRIGKQCVFAGENRGYFRYATTEVGCVNNNSEVYTGDNVRFQTVKVDFMSDGVTPTELGVATYAGVSDQTWFKIDNFRLYLQGDFNHDGQITLIDVTSLIKNVLESNPYFDYNKDGVLNKQDVLGEIDVLLHKW